MRNILILNLLLKRSARTSKGKEF